ncbi:MAG: signal peptidase I [Verrucomicrobiota bacterium]
MQAADIGFSVLHYFWKPKWKKEALATLKGGQKFLNYKRDLIEPARIGDIESRIKDLKSAIRSRNPETSEEACKQLSNTCENSLRSYRPPDALAENIEVFFVAIAVALGIRAYYVQPFRIPTGSMQPTLNGIVGHAEPDPNWKKPNILTQGWHKITEGRTYTQIIAPEDTHVVGLTENPKFFWFFQRTYIHYANGQKKGYGGSLSSILNGLHLGRSLGLPSGQNDIGETFYSSPMRNGRPIPLRIPVKKDQVLAQGWVDTGDLVLVDKVSYRFRSPQRGEVFVFETRGIENIVSEARLNDQNRGSHYIKRLAGVPGDKLQVTEPTLYVNGKKPSEKGFRKVMSLEDEYHGYFNIKTVTGVNPRTNPKGFKTFLNTPNSSITLTQGHEKDQYFALGDNSANSSDSRFWGPVDEYLLVGPGLFTLWPFENFGFIR